MSSTGAVYQRKSDGLWVAAVQRDNRRSVRYGKTEREARAKLKALLVAEAGGTLAPALKLTLSDWVEQWLTEVERRPSTLHLYASVLAPIVERVGTVRLEKLTPQALALTFTLLRRE